MLSASHKPDALRVFSELLLGFLGDPDQKPAAAQHVKRKNRLCDIL